MHRTWATCGTLILYFLYNNYWDKFLHKMLHVRHVAKGNLRVCYVNETSRFPYYSEIYV